MVGDAVAEDAAAKADTGRIDARFESRTYRALCIQGAAIVALVKLLP